MGNRWYDQYEDLGPLLDRLKELNTWDRDRLVRGIMELIRDQSPTLLDRFVLDFPLEIHRRRWYDRDPYLWLVMNGLAYADQALLQRVTAYLAGEYQRLAERRQRQGAAGGGQ